MTEVEETKPLIAFRKWCYDSEGLYSQNRDHHMVTVGENELAPMCRPWKPGEPAVCVYCERPGVDAHQCTGKAWASTAGIYVASAGFYGRLGPGLFAAFDFQGRVAGAMLVWGTVHLHEKGLRAEYALPVALVSPGSRGAIIEAAAAVYGAVVVPTWDEVIEEAKSRGGVLLADKDKEEEKELVA